MSTHWMHVTAGYALVLGLFLAMAVTATLRHRAAKATLARLDRRAASRAEARR